jgi:hypothetical protein
MIPQRLRLLAALLLLLAGLVACDSAGIPMTP